MCPANETENLCVNTIRMLAVDMVEEARSGHPGMPLGAAPLGHLLWTRFLAYDPADPGWMNRDRFILSAGHGSAMLYALLYLAGYDLSLDDLKCFRQWGSRTPGHPEYGHTPGVEATTGPLGQGFAMGVGMALAERMLGAEFNEDGFPVIDHYTYAVCSDGDLMEGISSEAASFAGHQELGKIIYLYDDNGITIEGRTDLAFSEDVGKRFESYGWQVLRCGDGNDLDALEDAVRAAREETGRPSLIRVRTRIGFGSPLEDDAACHGAPLGGEKAAATRASFGLPDERFHVPAEVREVYERAAERGKKKAEEWRNMFASYRERFPEKAAELERRMKGLLPAGWDEDLPVFSPADGPLATRKASGTVLNALGGRIPELAGGSADLGPSNNSVLKDAGDQEPSCPSGRNIHFGVREHAMGAMVNGMALHGGLLPYAATFLVFADYCRPALRLAALMKTRVVFIFTHDSIGVGEDGPTHQPVEQLASIRAIPGFRVFRPADANETREAWRLAVSGDGPAMLALSRQSLPVIETDRLKEGVARGGYVLEDAEGGTPDVIIIASGSEVHPACGARALLREKGIAARVVSMPCMEIFEAQPREYREEVLPPHVRNRVAVEAGSPLGWHRWVGTDGVVIGVEGFGASAPGTLLMTEYGFTAEHIAEEAERLVREGKE